MTPDLLSAALVVLTTYALHSTLMLGAAWLIDRRGRITSHAFRETLWKAAAVAPLLTTAIACTGGWTQPVAELAFAGAPPTSIDSVTPEGKSRPPAAHDAPDAAPRRQEEAFSATYTEIEVPLSADDASLADQELDELDEAASELPTPRTIEPLPDSHADKSDESAQPSVSADREAESFVPMRAASDQPDTEKMNSSSVGPALHANMFLVNSLLLGAALFFAVGLLLCCLRASRLAMCYTGGEVLRSGIARELLDRLCRDTGIQRRIRLRSCPRSLDAAAYGLFRWTIVLPVESATLLPPKQLEALLAHELAHLVRGDVAWLWVGQVLCTCLAWQPLNSLARRRWQCAAEYQCDDWAVDRGIEPLTLAGCLTEVAGWRIEGNLPAGALTATGASSEVGRRIRRLAEGPPCDRWREARRRWLLRAAALVMVAAFAWFAPRAVWSGAGSPTPPSTDAESLADAESLVDAESSAGSALLASNASSDDAAAFRVTSPLASSEKDALFDGPEPLAQWRELNTELRRLHETIAQLPGAAEQHADPRVKSLVEQLRRRAARLESQRVRLSLRLGDTVPTPLDAASSGDQLPNP